MPVVSRSMRLTDRGIYWVLAAALAAAGLIPEFRSLGNLANVATQSAALAVLAVGQTFVILCGLIDLSGGQLTGLIVVLVCDVAAGRGAMLAPALLLALGLRAGSGAATRLLNARRAGIDTDRVAATVFVISGVSAAIGGLLVAGRLGVGYPHAGTGFELDAIVAVVLGGTSLAGGRGSVAGTVAAVLLLGLTNNVLNLLQISSFIQMLVKGLIVIGAILVNQPGGRRAFA